MIEAEDPARSDPLTARDVAAMGGRARAEKLSPARRSEIASQAAAARWGNNTSKARWAAWYTESFMVELVLRLSQFKGSVEEPDPGERVDSKLLTPSRLRAQVVAVLRVFDDQGLLADAITPDTLQALAEAHVRLDSARYKVRACAIAIARALTAADSDLWLRDPPRLP